MAGNSSSFKSGFVAIVGLPNVGKSTLLNAILNWKLSAVSSKPQTTFDNVLGILNDENLQLVFVDTPGWLTPFDSFQAGMKKAVLRAVSEDADLILWLVDPRQFGAVDRSFAEVLKKSGRPVVVALNKIDLVGDKQLIAKVGDELSGIFGPDLKVYAISAKTREGLAPLKKELIIKVPFSSPYFPTDQITDRWERFLVAEIIRENIFESFEEEVPHASFVAVEEFKERPGQKDFISATIYVETGGQKRILIGKSGSAIKSLGEKSREGIERQLGRPVYLELSVKVHPKWREDNVFIWKMGKGGQN